MGKEKKLVELVAAIGDGGHSNNENQPILPKPSYSDPIRNPRLVALPNRAQPSVAGGTASLGNFTRHMSELVNSFPQDTSAIAEEPNNIISLHYFLPYSSNEEHITPLQDQGRFRRPTEVLRGISGNHNSTLNGNQITTYDRKEEPAALQGIKKRSGYHSPGNHVPVRELAQSDPINTQSDAISNKFEKNMNDVISQGAHSSNCFSRSKPVAQRNVKILKRVLQYCDADTKPGMQIKKNGFVLRIFCLHAMNILARIVQKNPTRLQIEYNLKEYIEKTLAAWNRRNISTQNFLEMIANFVCASCPEAVEVDIISEFGFLYERKLELQMQICIAKKESQKIKQQQNKQWQLKYHPNNSTSLTSGGSWNQVAHGVGASSNSFNDSIFNRNNMTMVISPSQREAQISEAVQQGLNFEPQFTAPQSEENSISEETLCGKKPREKYSNNPALGKVGEKSIRSKSCGTKKNSRKPVLQSMGKVHMTPPKKGAIESRDVIIPELGGFLAKNIDSSQKELVSHEVTTKMKLRVRPKIQKNTLQGGKGNQKRNKSSNRAEATADMDQTGYPVVNTPKRSASQATQVILPVSRKRSFGSNLSSFDCSTSKKQKLISKEMKGCINSENISARVPPTNIREEYLNSLSSEMSNVLEKDLFSINATERCVDELDVREYGEAMLLTKETLQVKLQPSTKRHGLDPTISREVMKIVSLAARERIVLIIKSLRAIARVRLDSEKLKWTTEPIGPNVKENIEKMEQEEERLLINASKMKVTGKSDAQMTCTANICKEPEKQKPLKVRPISVSNMDRMDKIVLEKRKKQNKGMCDALSRIVTRLKKVGEYKTFQVISVH